MIKGRENLTEGPLLKKMVLYALPLIATNVLQLLFNAADIVVVGKLVSGKALAAVGATGIVVSLLTCLFIGISVGSNVLVARSVGERNEEKAKRVIGTSVLFSVLVGIFIAVVGYFCSYTFLERLNCPSDIIAMSTKYLKIYFFGMPFIMLYNFAASILRAVGDTLRPFIFLIIGGFINVLLNIFLILTFDMDVEGVAIATVFSQAFSAVCCMLVLLRTDGYGKFEWNKLHLYKEEFIELVKIGLPAGLQSAMFSISNLLISSTINSFGSVAVEANTIAGQIDGIVYNVMAAFSLTCLAFVSQNVGAKQLKRVRKIVRYSVLLSGIISLALGCVFILLHKPICGIITNNTEAIALARGRIQIVCGLYFLFAIMEVYANAIRGLGKSTLAMVLTLLCCCVFRVIWLQTIYPLMPTLNNAYWVFPVSYLLGVVLQMAFYFPLQKKRERELNKEE